MTGEIATAISALTGIKTIADGLISVRDNAKVMEVKLALMSQVFEIRQALDALQDETSTLKQANRDLQEENRKLKERVAQTDRYELFDVMPGVYVYAAKPVDGARHKPPYFCQACYSNGKQTALAYVPPIFDFDPAGLRCPEDPRHSYELANEVTAKSLGYGS